MHTVERWACSRSPGAWCALAVVLMAAGAHGEDVGVGDPAGGSGFHEVDITAHPDSALAAALRSIEGQPLKLADAVLRALERATPVREAEADLRAAEQSVRRERGSFDPELFAGFERSRAETPSANVLAGADVLIDETSTTRAGARMLLPFGTDLELSLNTLRSETNSGFAALVPEFRTEGRLSVRQPLLQGFGPAARGELSVAERRLEAAESRFIDAVLAIRAEVEGLYWELYAAERDYAVALLIAERAEAFLEEAELRSAAGLVGPNEVANARVFLAEQQLAALDQQERLDVVSDRLATLLDLRPGADRRRFNPTDEPPSSFELEAIETLIGRALERNYELDAAKRNVASFEEALAAAKWDAYPELDLVGSVAAGGLAGTGRDVVFGQDTLRVDLDTGFGDAWSQVGDFDFPAWRIGVEFSIPIGLREGRGERDRVQAALEGATQQMVAVQRDLEERVRENHRQLENGARRLEVAREGVDAALEQVRIGVIEYNNGRTTAFELVRLGADLATAERRFSDSLVRTARAAAELRRLTGDGFEETETYLQQEGSK